MKQAETTYANQGWWGAKLADKRATWLKSQGTARDPMRFTAQLEQKGGSWLLAPPSEAIGTWMPEIEARLLYRWWLGIPLLPPEWTGAPCPKCGTAMDVLGNHLVCCKKNYLQRRHSGILETLVDLIRKAGFACREEQMAHDKTRPGDSFVPR